jgi:ParB family chromosome partitioning protein
MSESLTIPLNKLAPWSGNVRKTGVHDGIDELAASIASHGLLQSLVVQTGKRGKYEVVAGQRRLLALQSLAKAGTIAKDFPVPCMVVDNSETSTELSLAENVVRAPMHPADQFEAFHALAEQGESPADIAARFGISELAVAQRLKLGRLSPVILEAYRMGQLTLDAAQAFTVTDDRAMQERVYSQLTSWNRSAHTIRDALTEDEVATTDKRVEFVGLEAYTAAGGLIRQDLFSEDGEGYVVDIELLDRLVSEKLQSTADQVAAEGWLWVETATECDYQALSRFSRLHPEDVELSADEQAEYDALSEQYDTLIDSDDDADEPRLAEVEQRMDAITAKTKTWPTTTLAAAGAIVTIAYDGKLRIERGLVRKEDLPKLRKSEAADNTPTGSEDETSSEPGLSAKLVEELTAHKTAAIAARLIDNPDVALAAVVHKLVLDAFHLGYASESCLKLSLSGPALTGALSKPEACSGLMAIEKARENAGEYVPGSPSQLWTWCLERSRDELLQLLALVAAKSVDAIQHKADRPNSGRLKHAESLAIALGLDMTDWFKPTDESYFGRLSRTQILSAIDEAKGDHAPSLDKLKKAELAARAEQLLAGTGWLPEPLRIASAEAASEDDESMPLAAE